jgi:hypothetical protein
MKTNGQYVRIPLDRQEREEDLKARNRSVGGSMRKKYRAGND